VRWNVLLASLSASWGLIAVLIAAVDLDAEPLAFLRLSLAAVTLGAIALAARRSLRVGAALGGLIVLGVAQGAHWLLFIEAVKLGSVALATLTFYTAPVLIALAAPALLGERLSNVALGALVVGGVGVALVVLNGQDGGSFSLEAVAAGLGSAATYAAIVIVSKRLLRDRVEPLTVAFWNCAFGSVAVAPALLASSTLLPQGAGDWLAVLLLGVVFSGLSILAYTSLLRHVPAPTAGVLLFLEPVAGIVLAWALLDQTLAVATIVGGALVLAAGIGVVSLDRAEGGVTEAVPGVGSRSP
jgi:drug/metabolite transporter (DMT)-like permease